MKEFSLGVSGAFAGMSLVHLLEHRRGHAIFMALLSAFITTSVLAQQPTLELVESEGLPITVVKRSRVLGGIYQFESWDGGITWERWIWKPWKNHPEYPDGSAGRSKIYKAEEQNLPVPKEDKHQLISLARAYIGHEKSVKVGSYWNMTGEKKYNDNDNFAGFVYPRDAHRLLGDAEALKKLRPLGKE